MKAFLVTVLLGALVSVGFAAPTLAAAPAPAGIMAAECRGGVAGFLGFRAWHACLPLNRNGDPQITGLFDVWLIALVVLEDAIKAGAYVSAGFIIWGGVKYTKSQGDPGETQQARQIIHNALFGLVLTLLSVSIV